MSLPYKKSKALLESPAVRSGCLVSSVTQVLSRLPAARQLTLVPRFTFVSSTRLHFSMWESGRRDGFYCWSYDFDQLAAPQLIELDPETMTPKPQTDKSKALERMFSRELAFLVESMIRPSKNAGRNEYS